MSEYVLTRNRSRTGDVSRHLAACDGTFRTPLRTRVSIEDYAARLVDRAERAEAWSGADLIGLAALYCNAEDRQTAFLSNLSVVPAWTKKGIGRRLLIEALEHARASGFARLALSVAPDAHAVGLYRSVGFRDGDRGSDGIELLLDLRTPPSERLPQP